MLPGLIPIPAEAAASFSVNGDCTGRDVAWAMALLMQAVDLGVDGEVALPDNRSRELMGLKRRSTITVEEARWRRLRHLRINGRPAPCVSFSTIGSGTEWPVRHKTENDEIIVNVDADLASQFTDHGDNVYLPRRLLEGVDSRYTIILAMRMLAWSIGDYPKAWRVSDSGNQVRLRIPLGALVEILDVPSSMRPSAVVSKVLQPACDEITSLTDYELVMSPRIAASTGRIRDIEVTIMIPEVAAAVADMDPVEPRKGTWRRKDRPNRRRPERSTPADPVLVSKAALDAAAPLSIKRPPAVEKTSNRSDFIHSPGSSFGADGYGDRDTEIEF